MFWRSFVVTACVLFFAANSGCAADRKYVKHVQGRELVVHTNVAPVILHRISPPYLGKHVSERQLQKGRLPRGRR